MKKAITTIGTINLNDIEFSKIRLMYLSVLNQYQRIKRKSVKLWKLQKRII